VLTARIHSFGSDPVLEETDEPTAGVGEALVAIEAAAVGHIDLTVASGRLAVRPPLPYVPGAEGAGRVLISSGFPPETPVRIRGRGVGIARDGTWRERAVVPDGALVPIPHGVEPALATTFFAPCATAHAALHEVGELAPGERVAVTGAAGAVGSIAVQLARRGGAGEVIGVVSSAERLPAVPAGAVAIVRSDPDAGGVLRGETGLDLLVDTVGGQRLAELLGAMRPGGRIVLVGYTAGHEVSFRLPALIDADVRLLPVNLMRWNERLLDVGSRLLDELRRGELHLALATFPLRALGEAIEALRSGRAIGRIAVLPQD
jgi:NADPH2:quinone reductase